jgi:hypothetical protein
MRALGRSEPPASFVLEGQTYRHAQTIKHDFFAATAFYRADSGGRAVLKLSRTVDFAGLPLAWLGRWLCRREVRFYTKLADLPNVPAVLGRVGETGFVHAYVEGRPLSKEHPVPDGFFGQLDVLFEALHQRRLAYVDTNKPQNILLGEDGRPHLIDFQISWDLAELGDFFLNRWWLRHLQREDRYHLLKHWRRLRPDELSAEQLEASKRRSGLIRLHRMIFKPYFLIRRRTFARLRASGRLLPEGSK